MPAPRRPGTGTPRPGRWCRWTTTVRSRAGWPARSPRRACRSVLTPTIGPKVSCRNSLSSGAHPVDDHRVVEQAGGRVADEAGPRRRRGDPADGRRAEHPVGGCDPVQIGLVPLGEPCGQHRSIEDVLAGVADRGRRHRRGEGVHKGLPDATSAPVRCPARCSAARRCRNRRTGRPPRPGPGRPTGSPPSGSCRPVPGTGTAGAGRTARRCVRRPRWNR